jgi:hypothetical protein
MTEKSSLIPLLLFTLLFKRVLNLNARGKKEFPQFL